MNSLTIDDIHRIREEHAVLTQNMSFGDYKAELQKEIKPLLNLLKSMKNKKDLQCKIQKSYNYSPSQETQSLTV